MVHSDQMIAINLIYYDNHSRTQARNLHYSERSRAGTSPSRRIQNLNFSSIISNSPPIGRTILNLNLHLQPFVVHLDLWQIIPLHEAMKHTFHHHLLPMLFRCFLLSSLPILVLPSDIGSLTILSWLIFVSCDIFHFLFIFYDERNELSLPNIAQHSQF